MRRIRVAFCVVAVLVVAGTALGAAQGATPTFGKCTPTGKFGSTPLKQTVEPDTLTVGFGELTPLTYKGNTPASVDDGYDYCFAANIAWRAGLHHIALKLVNFAQLAIGKVGGYDMAIDDIYITPERAKHVDFSIPYGHAFSGVVGRTSTQLRRSNMRKYNFAVVHGSVQQKYLEGVLKPTVQYHTYDDSAAEGWLAWLC